MEQIYREYAAGSGSMAYGLFDTLDVLKRKYRSVMDRGTMPLPIPTMKFKMGPAGLEDLLSARFPMTGIWTQKTCQNCLTRLGMTKGSGTTS